MSRVLLGWFSDVSRTSQYTPWTDTTHFIDKRNLCPQHISIGRGRTRRTSPVLLLGSDERRTLTVVVRLLADAAGPK